MKIADILKEENCILSLSSTDKDSALKELTEVLAKNESFSNPGHVLDALIARERLGSTGIGDQIAIPHAKIKGLDSMVAAFGRSSEGIEYHALDEKPVKWIFLLLAAENATGAHLKALARISRLFKSGRLREKMETAQAAGDIFKVIQEEDSQLA